MIVRNVDSVRPSALSNELVDVDPQETAEWLDSLEAVLRIQGPDRAQFLLEALLERRQRATASAARPASTPPT